MEEMQDILTTLKDKFGPEIISADIAGDIPSVTVSSTSLFSIIEFLKNNPKTDYNFLTTLCGIHHPENELPFGIIYHLHNHRENRHIRIKTFVPLSKPEVSTITPLFLGANWMERETYDFYRSSKPETNSERGISRFFPYEKGISPGRSFP